MNWKKAFKTGTVVLMTATTAFSSACSWFGKDEDPVVKDDKAPVIKTAPADKVAELGFYSELQNDIASAIITDEESESVKRYPVSYSFGGKETAIEKDATGVFLAQVGEYVVTYTAEDFAGNKVNGTYKITAQDTTDPIVDIPAALVGWVEDGKVALPKAEVVEINGYNVAVTAKDSQGASVDVSDGYLMTTNTGVYTLTYTAKDSAGNETAQETKLVVNDTGVINTFTNAEETELWGSDVRGENGRLKLYSEQNTASISFNKYFNLKDWSAFERFYTVIENERGADLSVTPYVLVDGEWLETATVVMPNATLDTFDFVGVTAVRQSLNVYLDDYGFDRVEGLRFDFECQGGVKVAIDAIALDGKTTSVVTPEESALTGPFTAKYVLDGNESVYEELSTPISMPSGSNAVTYEVFSSVATEVTVGLDFGGEIVYARHKLNAGWNSQTRLVAIEGADITQEFVGVYVENNENYPVTLCVSNANVASVSSLSVEQYAKTNKTFAIAYGETFNIPNPFTVSSAYYSDVTVALSGSVSKGGLSIGDKLIANEDGLGYGAYTITYSYTDALGAAKTISYTLNVEKKVLVANVEMPALFMEGENSLPDPILESVVYSSSQLANATVQKLYRESGKTTWIDGSENFAPTKSKTYDIRYVVTLGDQRKEVNFQKYVHKNKNVIDFEPEDAAGVNSLRVTYGGVDNGKDYGVQKSQYLYDGGPVSYTGKYPIEQVFTSTDYAKSGSYSYMLEQKYAGTVGLTIRPLMVTEPGERVNCVSFWLKADKASTDSYLQFASFESKESDPAGLADVLKWPWAPAWLETERFDIKAGEHFYTIYLKDSVSTRSIGALHLVGVIGATYYFDDIEFEYINRLSMSDVSYENSFDVSKPYALEKPVLTSELFSDSELLAAKWSVKYTVNGGDVKELKADQNGNFAIPATENGEISLTWSATVNGVTVQTSATFIYGVVPFETDTPYVVNHGKTVNVPVPESEFALDTVKVEYKFFEDSEWTELTEDGGYYSFVADKQGQFNVRYTVSSNLATGTIYGEKIDNVYVPEKGVLFTFEDKDPRQGAGHFAANEKWHGANVVEKEDGTHWLQIKKIGDSFDGLNFATPYDLGVNTTKLAFDIYSSAAQPIYIHFTTTEGTYELTNYQIPAGDSVVEIDFADYGATNIRYVKSLYFYLHFGNGYTTTAFYIDNIRLVNEMTMNANVPNVATTETISFTPKYEFTVDTPEDFATVATISASYRELGATDWSAITSQNGTFSFTGTANVYEVKVTASYNGETLEEIVTVYNQSAGALLWNFESDWTNLTPDEYHHDEASSRSTDWSASGDYSWRIHSATEPLGLYGSYVGGYFLESITLSKTVSKVAFWTNCVTNVTLCLHIGTDQGTAEFVVRIDAGIQYNVFDLGREATTIKHFLVGGASPIGSFMITGSSNPALYIDDIVFYA